MNFHSKKDVINPTSYHTQILNSDMAEEFVKRYFCSGLASRDDILSFSIGFFSDLGYLPIPLLRYIYDNFN